ncbi:hypothetical protein SAY86_007719 [Trapa natans]|uniref:Sphingomyelin synthase-like domain-containing protein n=1 Tax=Trapa natans TaxID=22666 RepID=A0AAN7LDY2_TRANT|nr:hypothetical protein SAY86_007719 [Trapa natans]
MTLYIGREASKADSAFALGNSKLWKRICAETTTEINLLTDNWKYIIGGIIFQELGQDKAYISETLFSFLFLSFVLVRFYFLISSVNRSSYFSWIMQACQCLRIITFYSTQFPGPNYHCRAGSKLARLPPPRNVLEVLLIDFPKGVIYGCGDLIFSSHMIFTLLLCSHIRNMAQKELPDRTARISLLLLPVSIKDKNGWNKEENHKLLNGNSVDPADWRLRTQVNGKVLEDGNNMHDNAMNGA